MKIDYCGKCPCYDNEVNACNFPYTDCQELFEYYRKIGYQQGREDAIAEAEAKVKAYASIWMSYSDEMTKEQIAQEALTSAKEAMIGILEQIKGAEE